MHKLFCFIGTIFLVYSSFAQLNSPDNAKCIEFISPVNYPLDLSANFGELRYNHFHSGIDVRTKQTEGLPIRSIEDGYVSHIIVWGHGYGKTLFVVHENGIVSVYAHLQRFNSDITAWLHDYQYKTHINEVSVDVPKNAIIVRKGEVIALSGNSGGSRGPHLHFELRDKSMKFVYNPLMYYRDSLQDNTPPKFFYLAAYPLDDNSLVNGSRGRKLIRIIYSTVLKKYVLQQALTISGRVGLAIQANDFFQRNYHDFGLYSLSLVCDSQTVYTNRFDSYSLDDKKYINSFIDYEHFLRTGKYFQKMFVEPGNKMTSISHSIANGVLSFANDSTHQMTILATDYHGNEARVSFPLRVKNETPTPLKDSNSILLPCNQDNVVENNVMRLAIKSGLLYNDLKFTYSIDTLSKHRYVLSGIYKLGSSMMPLHAGMELSLPLRDQELYQNYSTKIYMAQISPKGYPIGYLSIKYNDGWATAYPDKFGSYALAIDTLKPQIRNGKLRDGMNLSKVGGFYIQAVDYQSGIASYNGYIDGKWVIMESDKKRSQMSCVFDDAVVERGKKHTFLFVVKDLCGNEATYTFSFYR